MKNFTTCLLLLCPAAYGTETQPDAEVSAVSSNKIQSDNFVQIP